MLETTNDVYIYKGDIVKMNKSLLVVACLLLSIFSAAAFPQDAFKGGSVRVIVGFPPGGTSTDIFARALSQRLSTQMNASFYVENRPGANGNIANELVVRSDPNGRTLLFNTSAVALGVALGEKLSYEVQRDLAPIALVAGVPLVFLVAPSIPASNIKEFIDYAKAHPNKLAYGSAGEGNISHLGSLLFLNANNLSALHVAYKGASAALTDVIAGRVQFATQTLVASVPLVKAGRIKAIAMTGRTRSLLLPDLPTMAEVGLPDMNMTAWYGVMAPAKTSPLVISRLNNEIQTALQDPETRQRLQTAGGEIISSTPEQYTAFIASEIERWSQLVRKAIFNKN